MSPVIGAVATVFFGAVSAVLALESPVTPDWANLSVGVAAIVGLVYVVRAMRTMFKDNVDANERRDSAQRAADLARDSILREVAVNLAVVSEQIRTLHADNVAQAKELRQGDHLTAKTLREENLKTAETLEDADQTVTRRVRTTEEEEKR